MKGFRKKIPSLNALVALEAVARHRSMTQAASELGVTQAAVSRQIGALEGEFDTLLFVRKHRSIEPTPECLLLAASLSNSFATIAQSVEIIRNPARSEVLTIGATLAFSSLWLLPRLNEVRERFPSLQIRLLSQDARFDLRSGEVDVGIRFGVPPFDDGEVIASRADQVYPVCAPAYAARFAASDAFLQAPVDLIENDVAERGWYSWSEWLARAGVKTPAPAPILRFNHYTDALEAAKAGQGVALGWHALARRFVEDGSLVRLGEATVVPDGRYNLIVPNRSRRGPVSDLAVQWLAQSL